MGPAGAAGALDPKAPRWEGTRAPCIGVRIKGEKEFFFVWGFEALFGFFCCSLWFSSLNARLVANA